MDAADLREIVGYLMVGGRKPKFFRPRAPLFVRLIDAIIPFVHLEPRNRIIKIARPNRFTVPTMLVAVGLVAVWFAYGAWQNEFEDSGNSWFVPVMLAAAAFVAASIIASRRKVLDAIPFQPARTPRREFLLDSWHVSVPEGGVDFLAFEERLLSRLRSLDKTIELAIETHQNLTPRGFEERERAVLSKGQATLHVHVYPFGTDAFVGWESYLNWNRWAEGEIVSTTVKDGAKLNFHSLGVGVHVPTDFDLIEANVLTETTHRILTKEIRLFLKEREIEADLDFKIIRGDRESALKRDLDDTAKPTKRTARRAVAMQ